MLHATDAHCWHETVLSRWSLRLPVFWFATSSTKQQRPVRSVAVLDASRSLTVGVCGLAGCCLAQPEFDSSRADDLYYVYSRSKGRVSYTGATCLTSAATAVFWTAREQPVHRTTQPPVPTHNHTHCHTAGHCHHERRLQLHHKTARRR